MLSCLSSLPWKWRILSTSENEPQASTIDHPFLLTFQCNPLDKIERKSLRKHLVDGLLQIFILSYSFIQRYLYLTCSYLKRLELIHDTSYRFPNYIHVYENKNYLEKVGKLSIKLKPFHIQLCTHPRVIFSSFIRKNKQANHRKSIEYNYAEKKSWQKFLNQ